MPTLITLTLIISGGVILLTSVIWFYYHRRPGSAVHSPAPLNSAPQSNGQGLVPAETVDNSSSWRPPPRGQLLRRQEALLRLTADAPAPAHHSHHAHPLDLHTEMALRRAITDGHAVHPVAPPPTSARAGAPRVSRIGRQRQGLESLITELPSSANDTDK